MIRDTFETNPGLCELFRRKILERARVARFNESLIDFDAHLDKKGTYQDNLRIFYRRYPQLTQHSDYLRISSIRPLSGVALEHSWRGYEREHRNLRLNSELIKSDWLKWNSIITEFKPEPIQKLDRQDANGFIHEDGEPVLSFRATTFQSILDWLTATSGEKVAKIILHQMGKAIGRTAFSHLPELIPPNNLTEALDHALSTRGCGQVLDLNGTGHGSSLAYVCSVKGCPICYKRVSTSPTCDVMRGIVSGWLESFVQKSAESSVETACVAMGSQVCVFRVTFVR
jgi:predicted hydrocarbon binding protein